MDKNDAPAAATQGSNSAPVSMIQRQFWVLNKREPLSSAYNIPMVSRIRGNLDVSALEIAINVLMRRHRIFRTTFEIDHSGRLVQNAHPWCDITLPRIDLRRAPTCIASDDDVNGAVTREIRAPFDLAKDFPVRFKLFLVADRSFMLAITAHHIVFDLATKDMFAEELEEEYRAASLGHAKQEIIERSEYAEYSVWQEHWLQGEEHKRLEDEWRRYLDGTESSLNLPTDKPPALRATRSGNIVRIGIESALADRLRRFSQESEVTPFLVLLTAWALTLSRWTGQRKLCIGVPLTNRRKEAYKKAMGCFVNILPLNVDISDSPALLEVLRRIRMTMLKMHRIQELPYYHLVQEIRPKGSSDENPFFQAGFTFEHPLRLKLDRLDVEPVYFHHGGSQLDLFATFWQEAGEILGVIEFNCDLFDPFTVESIRESLIVALEALCNDAQCTVDSLTLLSDEGLDLIINKWNATTVPFDRSAAVHELIERSALSAPDEPAVRYRESLLTYSQLVQRARDLSRYLRHLGVGREEPIGVCVERNLDLLPVLTGILMAGCAYVPLDPTFPSTRLRFMTEDAKLRFIVGAESKRHLFSEIGNGFIPVDHVSWSRYAPMPESEAPKDRGSLAYIMYTSGSTGMPKGVEIRHSAVVNLLESMKKRLSMTNTDRLLAVTTVSFDISVLELFLPLVSGACTVIAPDSATFDGEELFSLMQKTNPTVMQATPVTWRLLLAAGMDRRTDLKVLCGGEAMSLDLMKDLLKCCRELWNVYGPTETTIWSTCQRCSDDQPRVSIGRPLDNTITHILDPEGRPLPIGVWGELYIGGEGLARGYRNQPGLTAERFVHDPITPGGGRLYRTGDRCRFLTDGSIEYGGRLDNQIKIRGHRIEAGEVEKAIGENPAIRDAVVDSREDAMGSRRLVAWLILNEGRKFDRADLCSFLRDRLPDYMIPQVFLPVENLALTPNRKVDRKALPDPPELSAPPLPSERVEMGLNGAEERDVRGIWERLLGHIDFGNDDRFFDAGGDSLLAIRLRDLLLAGRDVDIPISVVFQYPTVRQQAEYLKKKGKGCGVLEGMASGAGRGLAQAAAMARRRRTARSQIRSKDE